MGNHTRIHIKIFINMKLMNIILTLSILCLANGEKNKSGSETVLICTLCESIMTSIDESIVDPTNEQEIADYLAQICNYVGANLEAMCLEFINEYTDDITDQLVNNYLNPDQIC